MKTARDKIIASMLEGERVQAELLTNATSEAFSLLCEGWRKSGVRVKLRQDGLPSVIALLAVSIAEYNWTKREGESSYNRPLEVFLDNMVKDFNGKDAAILYVSEDVESTIERAYSVPRLKAVWKALKERDSRLFVDGKNLMVKRRPDYDPERFEELSVWDLRYIFRVTKEPASIGQAAKRYARKARNLARQAKHEAEFGHNEGDLLAPMVDALTVAADQAEEAAKYPTLVCEVEELKDKLLAKQRELQEFKAKRPSRKAKS
jgi:hypothetical protein